MVDGRGRWSMVAVDGRGRWSMVDGRWSMVDGRRSPSLIHVTLMSALFSTPVREYMSRSLVSVPPDTPLEAVARTLEQRDISSVVVTGDDGIAQGVVSMTDLLREARFEGQVRSPLRILPEGRFARDVMRSPPITVDEAVSVRAAAEALVTHRIHRVVVTRAGKAVAVFSTRDLMRVVHFHHVELPLSAVMTTPVQTVGVGDPIEKALARLDAKSVRGLVVVDGDAPVGIFTQAEALKAQALPEDVLGLPVEEVMSYEILCLGWSTPLYRVAGHAAQMGARRVLAVEGNKLRGIVTGFDLARVATMDLDAA
jgi:CBS domain-containing protein